MTQKEFEVKFLKVLRKALFQVKAQCPVRSGNLKSSIKLVQSPMGYKIYIDTNQANYMPYTTEKWISPQWRDRANPNEAWFDDAAVIIDRIISNEFGAGKRM